MVIYIIFYYNAPASPDLSPIENAWRFPAMAIKDLPWRSHDQLIKEAKEAWEMMPQETINR